MPARIDLSVGAWNRVSPKYVVVVVVSTLISGIFLSAVSVFLWLVAGWSWAWIALIVIVVVTLISLFVANRRTRSRRSMTTECHGASGRGPPRFWDGRFRSLFVPSSP